MPGHPVAYWCLLLSLSGPTLSHEECVAALPPSGGWAIRGLERRPSAGRGPELRFRIVNELAYFTREYDPANEAHDLRIGFASDADLARFRNEVLPGVLRQARK